MKQPSGPFWLDPGGSPTFPRPELAAKDPDGLLAVGGRLEPEWLLLAYRHGIFPWFSDGQPILWWSPAPRAVLYPERLKISRSLRKTLRRDAFEVSMDRAFAEVLEGCSGPRRDGDGTWITDDMKEAYLRLHALGHAHSVESWRDGELVGGLYGVAIGRMFFGESMFTRASDASKVAFVHLVRQLQRWGFGPIDCQMATTHLLSLGAETIDREPFQALLDEYCAQPAPPLPWRLDPDLEPIA